MYGYIEPAYGNETRRKVRIGFTTDVGHCLARLDRELFSDPPITDAEKSSLQEHQIKIRFQFSSVPLNAGIKTPRWEHTLERVFFVRPRTDDDPGVDVWINIDHLVDLGLGVNTPRRELVHVPATLPSTETGLCYVLLGRVSGEVRW